MQGSVSLELLFSAADIAGRVYAVTEVWVRIVILEEDATDKSSCNGLSRFRFLVPLMEEWSIALFHAVH
jgi:hypothetical protein